MSKPFATTGWGNRVRGWFPDREFFMRSEGQVRFITISSRLQMTAAAIALAVFVIWMTSMAVAGWTQYRATADRLSLLDREAKVATATERVDAYRNDIDAVASDLVKRQEFIEDMVASLPEDVKAVQNVSDSSGEAAAMVDKVSVSIPEAGRLARIEARQLAFVEGLTRYADWRSQRAAAALKKLGLNPDSMIRNADRGAMGGPLEKLTTGAGDTIDPRFERLGLSIARMDALERGLDGVPQVAPANVQMVTSSYGYRRDPFTGVAAMHKGLDFRGPTGTPIYAASDGRISFVGRKSGYGNVVEISHGNGLMTRYAHMSKFNAKVGQTVEAGQTIGAIGSTGRSTGPHLHFEVVRNAIKLDPMPYLTKQSRIKRSKR